MKKSLFIINGTFLIIIMNSHENLVHCWKRKSYLRYWWIFLSFSAVIVFLFVSSKNSSCSNSESSMFFFFVSIRWVSSWVLCIGLVWSHGYSNQTNFNFGIRREIVAWGEAVLDISVFLLNSLGRNPLLWLFWRSWSLDKIFFMKIGPLKGQVSSFPSCWINNSLTTLLLITHPIQSTFRYVIDKILGLW